MAVALTVHASTKGYGRGQASEGMQEVPNLKTGFALSANLSSIFLREWGGKQRGVFWSSDLLFLMFFCWWFQSNWLNQGIRFNLLPLVVGKLSHRWTLRTGCAMHTLKLCHGAGGERRGSYSVLLQIGWPSLKLLRDDTTDNHQLELDSHIPLQRYLQSKWWQSFVVLGRCMMS